MSRSADLAMRLEFLDFDASDVARLREIRPLLEEHAEDLVAAFYRHLLSYAIPSRLLADAEVRDRLLKSQREYLMSLATSDPDDDYVTERLFIGETHDRVGLEPRWYFGAYSHYFGLLTPLICDRFRGEPQRGAAVVTSLEKILTLDAQLAMEAYIAKREEKLDFLNRELADTGRGLAREVDEQRLALRESRRRTQAAERLASVGTLAAGLAHEIGTPMSVIRGHAEMLEGAVEDPRARWRLETIKEQIDRISNIMQGLLNMARPREPVHTKLPLQSVVETALSFLTEKLRRRQIEVRNTFDEQCEIQGDPERLQQLFLNLILNAADAMEKGGTLKIRIRRQKDDQVEVRLRDSGVGIPVSDLGRIFEPFFTSKEAGHGSGLGLVVAKEIVVDHGGELSVASDPGQGTEFRMLFPAA